MHCGLWLLRERQHRGHVLQVLQGDARKVVIVFGHRRNVRCCASPRTAGACSLTDASRAAASHTDATRIDTSDACDERGAACNRRRCCG